MCVLQRHRGFWLGELRGRYHLEDLGVDGRILLYFGRVPAANAPGCTAAEGLLYKPWSLVVPTCTAKVSPPETLIVEGGTTCARNGRWILPENARLPRNIQGSFKCRKYTTWDKRLYFPSEGRRPEDFFSSWKIRRLRPSVGTHELGVPKASTLPLDHRSRIYFAYSTGFDLKSKFKSRILRHVSTLIFPSQADTVYKSEIKLQPRAFIFFLVFIHISSCHLKRRFLSYRECLEISHKSQKEGASFKQAIEYRYNLPSQ